jgi:hypothetical protein
VNQESRKIGFPLRPPAKTFAPFAVKIKTNRKGRKEEKKTQRAQRKTS